MTIAQRVRCRSFPSVFMAWNVADNLPDEDPFQTAARHDLIWCDVRLLGLRWKAGYAGLGTDFTPESVALARGRRERLLALNPNLLLLAEVRWRTAPEDWLPATHPWWQRDRHGKRVVGWAEGGYYLLDWHNPEMRRQVVAHARACFTSGNFDGVMLDEWDDDDPELLSVLRDIRTALGDDALIIINHNARLAPNAAPYINGLYMESCFWSDSRRVTLAPSAPWHWQQISDTLLWAEANLRSPCVNAIETWHVESRQELNRMRATTTLALTHSNGYALFADPNYLPAPDHLHDWYDFWDHKELGRPLASMTARPDGACQREFSGGTVVYNPAGNRATMVVFGEPRLSAATKQVGRAFQLQALDGDLYLNLPAGSKGGSV